MKSSGTLDDMYLEWLYGHIASIKNPNPDRSYWELSRQLFKTPFVWTVPNDDNRAEDGKALRDEFIHLCDIQDLEINWLQLDCSMLEMLIALSRRSAFESQGSAGDWFWKIIDNLQIRFNDRQYSGLAREEVDLALDRVNTRTYEPNGDGGLFPLHNTNVDQRTVELWYQLSTYILENNYLDHAP